METGIHENGGVVSYLNIRSPEKAPSVRSRKLGQSDATCLSHCELSYVWQTELQTQLQAGQPLNIL